MIPTDEILKSEDAFYKFVNNYTEAVRNKWLERSFFEKVLKVGLFPSLEPNCSVDFTLTFRPGEMLDVSEALKPLNEVDRYFLNMCRKEGQHFSPKRSFLDSWMEARNQIRRINCNPNVGLISQNLWEKHFHNNPNIQLVDFLSGSESPDQNSGYLGQFTHVDLYTEPLGLPKFPERIQQSELFIFGDRAGTIIYRPDEFQVTVKKFKENSLALLRFEFSAQITINPDNIVCMQGDL